MRNLPNHILKFKPRKRSRAVHPLVPAVALRRDDLRSLFDARPCRLPVDRRLRLQSRGSNSHKLLDILGGSTSNIIQPSNLIPLISRGGDKKPADHGAALSAVTVGDEKLVILTFN